MERKRGILDLKMEFKKYNAWRWNITTKRIWAKLVIDFGPFRFVWYS